MKKVVSINLSLGGVNHRLQTTEDNEENLRAAAAKVNERYELYRNQIPMAGNAVLMTMVALSFSETLVGQEQASRDNESEIINSLADIMDLLDSR